METLDNLSNDEIFVKKLASIVNENLDNNQFGAEQLASCMGLSRSQIHRRLNHINGKSTTQFIREIRLKRAHSFLEDGTDTSSDIAYKVGFGSPTYFYKCFHEYFGYSPGEVKRRLNQDPNMDSDIAKKKISIIPIDARRNQNTTKKTMQINFRTLYYAIAGVFLITLSIIFWNYLVSKRPFTTESSISKNHRISLAILPFKDLSQNKDKQYFCDGIMDEIISQLQKIQDIRVKSRTDVEKYRNTAKNISEIAKELNVGFILEGSIINYGENFRLITKLIDGKSGDNTWAEKYDGIFSDSIFDIQSALVKNIASSLHAEITPKEIKRIEGMQTTVFEAYRSFLNAQYELELFWRTGDSKHIELSHALNNKAISLDSNFARPYVNKASAFFAEYKHDSMLYYANRAIEKDPTLPGGYDRKAKYYARMNMTDSLLYYLRKSNELNPYNPRTNFTIGELFLREMKSFKSGLPYLKRAIEFADDNSGIYYDVGLLFFRIGAYDLAEILFQKAIKIGDGCRSLNSYCWLLMNSDRQEEILNALDAPQIIYECNDIKYEWLIRVSVSQRNFDQAEAHYQEWKIKGKQIYSPEIGYMYHMVGKKEESQKTLIDYIDNVSLHWRNSARLPFVTYNMVQASALLQEKEIAYKYLNGYNSFPGFPLHKLATKDPMLVSLWDDPEFEEVIKKEEEYKSWAKAQIEDLEDRGQLDWVYALRLD